MVYNNSMCQLATAVYLCTDLAYIAGREIYFAALAYYIVYKSAVP